MLPRLWHHSDDPTDSRSHSDDVDEENTTDEEQDEQDEQDEGDEQDEQDEQDEGHVVVDVERRDKKNLRTIISVFQHIVQSASSVVDVAVDAYNSYTHTYYDKQPYHTSALSGSTWVNELIHGHPERIRCELGVHHHVYLVLLNVLREGGIHDSKNVTLEEQLAIFLYACVTGLSVRHLGERFQRSNDTISKYVFLALVTDLC
jgi:hypothetical protein